MANAQGKGASRLGRSAGVLGLLLGVALACTQLLGDQQNTLAPATPPSAPGVAAPPLLPRLSERPLVCADGETRCEGALVQRCADDLTAWITVQRCGAAALCQASPALCLQATCSEDEMTCAGSALQKCNADRTGWDVFATCLSPAHCNADQRQCQNEPCAAGERRCDRSDADQLPVLEVCRDDRLDWGPLDACVTRELCDQTLTTGIPGGGLIVGSDGMVQVQAPASPDTVLRCNLPACNVGEVRCNGVRLEFCSEGRTGWLLAEECASDALCNGSIGNLSSAGTAACLPPACATGQHQCTAGGVLQLCGDDRTGYRDQEVCIGAPFCNAVAADQGQPGCRDAPCEAGQMQCNGAQIQVCRDDRTALDDVGAPCESTALCNADDPLNALCEEPACRRGPASGSEFHCAGAELQRCNESLTGYDTIQTCATAALCDPSQRFSGCKAPTCQADDHACSGGFLQRCNADQTAFNNVENCGSQAQCDANAGRCADPCEPGTTRCNQSNGDLERCTDRLTGWQPIADCPNVALCDLANSRCDICLGGQFSCADGQLRQCSADGGTFSRQNIGAECAPLPNNGGVGVRVCQGNTVAVSPCQLGCTNGRCNECTGNQTRCAGNQIQRCVNGFFAAPTSCSDGNACNGTESCQNNACVPGTALACNDNNRCTNDSCNPGTGCQFAPANNQPAQCVNGALQTCVNGQLQTSACGQLGCVNNRCANCSTGACDGNQFIACNGGQPAAAITCPDDNNPCTAVTCSPQNGCGLSNLSNVSCADNDRCDGAETCQNGVCQAGNRVTCTEDANPCTTVSCNTATGACGAVNVANGTACPGGVCQAGSCRPTCTTGSCNGIQFTACTNGQPAAPVTCPDDGNNNPCRAPSCSATGCGLQNVAGNCSINGAAGTCQGGSCQLCTPGQTTRCTAAGGLEICNGTGTGFQQANSLSPSLGICNAAGTVGTRCVGTTVTPFPCLATEICLNGFCENNFQCTPGTARCADSTPQVCIASGLGFLSPAFCDNGVTRTCVNGAPTAPQPCPDDGNECTLERCATNTAPRCESIARTGTCTRSDGSAGECSGTECIRRCSAATPCPGTEVCQANVCRPSTVPR